MLTLYTQISMAEGQCELEVTHQRLESQKDFLIHSLLKLVLSKTETRVCLVEINQILTDGRKTRRVAKGELSLKWASVSKKVNDALLPVQIPIFKGLMGYRIFVIRKGEHDRFSKVNTVENLKAFRAGTGKSWGDRFVLEKAGLPVITSTRGRFLWGMLISKRFDYLPLGLHEPWDDISRYPEELSVEQTLMVSYPMALYFYVKKDNDTLFTLISEGMEAAIKDGSYDKNLYQSKIMVDAAKYTQINQRRIITIANPFMPLDTPYHRKEYWIEPQTFKEQVNAANQ